MITPFDVDDDYEIMLNVKYNIEDLTLQLDICSTKCQTIYMGMHMG